MANFFHLAVCVFFYVLLSVETIHGHPISPEDVVSLLPEIPKTKNETVAAIVEDPVIQDAVQSVVGDGTLSGLVVKKNTVILPADKPDVVLTQNEQILTAPLSHLEDIRKNITETVATISEKENSEVTAVDEISVAEVVPMIEKIITEVPISEKAPENPLEVLIADSLVFDKQLFPTKSSQLVPELVTDGKKLEVPGIVQSEIKLPEGIFPGKISLPDVIHDEIAKPVVAILNPRNLETSQGSAIDLVPALDQSSDTISAGENSELDEMKKEIREYGARIIPVAVITTEEFDHPAVKIEGRSVPEEKPAKNLLATFLVAEEKSSFYQSDENDMVAAEDIIFRPLFRYRQQQNDRLRVLENRSYQRAGYNRYRPSSFSYYSSSNENYNSRKNYYKKPQRARYYNDYY